MSTVIISPAYNVEEKVNAVLRGLQQYRSRVLFVDDGSTDNTYNVIQNAGYECIRCEKNKGVAAALLKGMQWSLEHDYDAAVILDSDGQHNPKFISAFEEKLQDNELVTGNRFHDFSVIPSNKLASNATISIVLKKMYGINMLDVSCGYKAFRLEPWVIETVANANGYSIIYDVYFRALMEHRKVDIVNVPCIYPPNELQCTKRNELLGFFKTMREALRLQNVEQINFDEICGKVSCREDFILKIYEYTFYGFYLGNYDGYILQTDMVQLQKHFNSLLIK